MMQKEADQYDTVWKCKEFHKMQRSTGARKIYTTAMKKKKFLPGGCFEEEYCSANYVFYFVYTLVCAPVHVLYSRKFLEVWV